jgi:predicted nucleic acid-binding Zn ribbon protein
MERKIKDKKCKECGGNFTPFKTTQVVCSPKCASVLAEKKMWKEKKKIMIENTRTRTEWLTLLQIITNKLIRAIDNEQPCMSCGKLGGKPQAGHYHSVQSAPVIRFHLFNIWMQDYRCNVELSSNIIGYNKGLIENFDEKLKEYVEIKLPLHYHSLKLTTDEIKTAITKTKNCLKTLEVKKYTKDERIELRKKFSEIIGLYKIYY